MNNKLLDQTLLANTNNLLELDKHTQTLVWAGVIGISIIFIIILLLIHFLYWRNKNAKFKEQRLGVQRERSFLFEIKQNIFLILSSLFAISLIVGLVTIIKLNI
ncbi:hypothetical protein [Spiroplasma melliferum]|uniref:Uncharacterized protein n=2 Tax=Spiroplasma melliferum TaxID=2134 RepID=A0AAI9T431_SPIME|nr:hypothetical protein [Spiroplasma melliferum]ELL44651.1 hypothetical protein SMIPMB4A_v3c3910 [Spiroplasma melliferum IPMB4A]KAI92954.1 hypothetical protein SPM_002970 [Spiroplasma melliferum KC3]QCO23874.1 hypothetical protein SRED_002354 [Spiroplasma melliferum]